MTHHNGKILSSAILVLAIFPIMIKIINEIDSQVIETLVQVGTDLKKPKILGPSLGAQNVCEVAKGSSVLN